MDVDGCDMMLVFYNLPPWRSVVVALLIKLLPAYKTEIGRFYRMKIYMDTFCFIFPPPCLFLILPCPYAYILIFLSSFLLYL